MLKIFKDQCLLPVSYVIDIVNTYVNTAGIDTHTTCHVPVWSLIEKLYEHIYVYVYIYIY